MHLLLNYTRDKSGDDHEMIDVELNAFLNNLNETNRKPAAKTYRSVLTSFGTWLDKRGKTLSTFTTNDADTYFRTIENIYTANMFLGALKSYMAYKFRTLPAEDPQFAVGMQKYMQLESIKARQKRRIPGKVALTPDEIAELLGIIEKRKHHEVLYAGTVLCFLWGARSLEQEHFMRASGIEHHAEYRWDKNEMMLWTTKVHYMRFLAWHPKFTPYIKTWVKALPFTTPGEYLTTHLNKYEIGGLHITSRVGRKSVQTNLILNGAESWIVDAVLGHQNTSSISDTYTDFTMYEPKIKDVFVNKHYMNELI
jgi:site-specific recombinase XerD